MYLKLHQRKTKLLLTRPWITMAISKCNVSAFNSLDPEMQNRGCFPANHKDLVKDENEDYVLLLLDLRLPGMDEMEVLRRIRELRPDIGVIVLTAYGAIELAVRAMKPGAVEFVQKPFAPQEIRESDSVFFAATPEGGQVDTKCFCSFLK
jgi:CheY-like chemotaxis protein